MYSTIMRKVSIKSYITWNVASTNSNYNKMAKYMWGYNKTEKCDPLPS